jgi:hypothetical protein
VFTKKFVACFRYFYQGILSFKKYFSSKISPQPFLSSPIGGCVVVAENEIGNLKNYFSADFSLQIGETQHQ